MRQVEEEGVDAAWLEAHVAKREAYNLRERRTRARERAEARRLMSLDERYALVKAALSSFAVSRAGSIERAAASADRAYGPGDGSLSELAYLNAEDVDRLMALAGGSGLTAVLAMEQLEHAVDTHQGLALPQRSNNDVVDSDGKVLLGDELGEEGELPLVAHPISGFSPDLLPTADKDDLLITRCVGLTPDEINEVYPFMGSPRTIRKTRKAYGADTESGYAIEQEKL